MGHSYGYSSVLLRCCKRPGKNEAIHKTDTPCPSCFAGEQPFQQTSASLSVLSSQSYAKAAHVCPSVFLSTAAFTHINDLILPCTELSWCSLFSVWGQRGGTQCYVTVLSSFLSLSCMIWAVHGGRLASRSKWGLKTICSLTRAWHGLIQPMTRLQQCTLACPCDVSCHL